MLNGMDMETNLHYYSSERLAFDHFDLLALLWVHNAREGQTRQATTRIVFLSFNDGKVTFDGSPIRERYRQPTAQLTQLHEAPLQAIPHLVKERLLVMLVKGNLHIQLACVNSEQFTVFALRFINQSVFQCLARCPRY
jgi:hypothetical protein